MRNILISGASRGIGKAIAIKLLKEGHSISIGVRKKESIINTPTSVLANNEYNYYIHCLRAHLSEFSIEAQYVPQQEAAFETEF